MLSSRECSRTIGRPPRTVTSRPWLLAAAFSVPFWLACGTSSNDDDSAASTGGSSTGGAATGGSATGGLATGGVAAVGSGTGGLATGGVATGGSATGGVSTGGMATGGFATGGLSTGGVATGGVATGGVATGGLSTGGAGIGGSSTGGAATGGVATGGVATGGVATGGQSTGGAGTGGVSTGGASGGGAGEGGSSTGGASGGGSGEGGAAGGGTGGSAGTGSPGCGSSTPLQSGNYSESIGGANRTYVLDVPTDYDTSNQYRLVFVWHPLGGSANQVVSGGYDGLKALANGTAIFVAADGLNGSNHEASGVGWWNVDGVDMEFLSAMIDRLNSNLCIDQERIFSTGFSFGGMMSYTVGFEFDVFRAIAPCSGDLEVIPHNDNNTAPLPMIAFHGTSDNVVNISRGQAARDQYLARNNCGSETQPVDPNPCVQYQGCDVPTIWCQFDGGHAPYSAAPQAIWDFFSQY